MSPPRVSVDRELYWSALVNASAWQQSILDTHDEGWESHHGPTVAHCKPGARCEQYKIEAALLARYAAAQSRLRRR